MVTSSVGLHGPSALAAKPPVALVVESVTVTGDGAVSATVAVWSCTPIGCDGAPAVSDAGAVVKPSAGGDQVENVFQVSTNAAPSTADVHHASPHAPAGDWSESWIDAARRSSSA